MHEYSAENAEKYVYFGGYYSVYLWIKLNTAEMMYIRLKVSK
jgi:hypothetical protein